MGLLDAVLKVLLPQAEEGQETEHQSPSLHPPEFGQEHAGGRQAAQDSEPAAVDGETSAEPLPARQRPPAPEHQGLPASILDRFAEEPLTQEVPPEPELTIHSPELVPGELDGRPVQILDLSRKETQ